MRSKGCSHNRLGRSVFTKLKVYRRATIRTRAAAGAAREQVDSLWRRIHVPPTRKTACAYPHVARNGQDRSQWQAVRGYFRPPRYKMWCCNSRDRQERQCYDLSVNASGGASTVRPARFAGDCPRPDGDKSRMRGSLKSEGMLTRDPRMKEERRPATRRAQTVQFSSVSF